MDNSPSPKKTSSSMGIIFLIAFLDLLGFSIIFPLLPGMLDYYSGVEVQGGLFWWFSNLMHMKDAPPERVAACFGGALGSIYALLQFFFAPIWGSLSDRYGRRPIFLISTAGMAVSYAVWFFSGSFSLLVISRLIGGIMAGNIATATAAIADVTAPKDRAKGMGMIGMAFGLGFVLGPAMGAVMMHLDLTSFAAFKSLRGIGLNPFSMAAAAAFVLALGNFTWVLLRYKETLPASITNDPTRPRRPINPLLMLRPLSLPGVGRTALINLIYFFAFSGMEFTLVFLAAERFAFTSTGNASMFTFIGLTLGVTQGVLVRKLAPKFGERKMIIGGIFLVLPGLLLIGFGQAIVFLYGGLFFLAVGTGVASPAMTALASRYAPYDRQGEVMGVFRSMGSLARAFGPFIAGMIYLRYGSTAPYIGAVLIMFIPLVLAFTLKQPSETEPSQ